MMLSIFSMQSERKVIESAKAGRLVVMLSGDLSQKKPEWSAELKATGADGVDDYYAVADRYGRKKKSSDAGKLLSLIALGCGVSSMSVQIDFVQAAEKGLPTDLAKAAAARLKKLQDMKLFAEAEAEKALAESSANRALADLDSRYAERAEQMYDAAESLKADAAEAQRQIDSLPAISIHPDN